MKTPIIKTEDVIRGKKTVTVPATFNEDALEQMRAYHQQGLKHGSWDLDEPYFIGWMSAVGVVSSVLGNQEENEQEKRIKELEAEISKLKKAKK